MFPKIPKIFIFAFVIAPVLVFGNANGYTESATLPTTTTIAEDVVATATATPTGTATTTTLASSNAPATITNDAGVLRVSSRRIATAAATVTAAAERRSPPLENDEVTTTTKSTFADFTDVPTTTNFESKSRAAMADQGSNGNEGKIRQIKNAKEHTELYAKTTASAVASVEGEKQRNELKTPNEQDAPATQVIDTVAVTNTAATLMPGSGTPEGQRSQRWSNNDDEETSSSATTSAPTMPNNGVHVERLLDNGLYRIKLAEIVTDEFSGLPRMTTETETLGHELDQQQQSHHSQPYQVRENGGHDADDDKNNNSNGDAGKLNIIDLYPMKMEDFKPIIRDSNAKLLKERTIFTRLDAEEHRQNLMPNEVEQDELPALPARQSVNRRPSTLNRDSVNEFTGKLLAEQDGVITEIEQKFQINEFVASETPASASASTPSTSTVSTSAEKRLSFERPNAKLGKFSFSVNHKLHAGSGHDFIDRRVKKSFDFPMHRAASDVMSLPHIDFANTKFNTDTSGNPGSSQASGSTAAAAGVAGAATNIAAGIHPEFSTTKFYNSKELYNEMLQHNKQKLKTDAPASSSTSTTASSVQTNGASRFGTLQTSQVKAALKNVKDFGDASQPLVVTATTIEGTTSAPQKRRITIKPTTAMPADTSTMAGQTSTRPATAQPQPTTSKKFQKELKRAKLLLKVMRPKSSATTTTTTTTQQTANTGTTTRPTESIVVGAASTTATNTPAVATVASASASAFASSATATPSSLVSAADNILNAAATSSGVSSTSASASSSINAEDDSAPLAATSSVTSVTITTTARPPFPTALSQRRATNPTKSTSKPIARPRILSRLQEKINSLECELQNVPPESHLWRGNETHELLLPIVSPENCNNERDCSPLVISWEGEAEIQSGDILIVEINDALLIPNDKNASTFSAHTTQVYQVTRSGHEHCDVTEGILLDITPLVVDGRKLVTLYDKDLTEGVNLLIVVSELWGSQCVRLKVTTKTDNCGENSDCSGKGVCFSNAVMEEYECQCCSGFAGPHCEEIDACTPSPCTNNGICVDLSQGHEGNSYQCLCPYGYTGKNCQYESDPCNPADCMNGGSCVGNSTHFRCDCTPGYAGPICQHSLNECESSPCVHGICVDQEDGFRCFCQPGFAGELCNFEYNECESNPCQNGGECIDHIGSYECRCTKGYTGTRCQIKVDFCANKPCPEGHRCIDHGNDFSCECPGGRNGPDCNQMPRTQCNVNPCTHGGTCWSSGDSFYCACRPGYTGTMCEDEFVVETVVSSSEFMVDDTSARNFNDKTFGSSVVLKSPIELHNAYFAAGVLAAAIFIVAIVVTICHCKVNQTYRKFSTRSTSFFPILGFGRRPKAQKLNKHWLSGKGLGSGNPLRSSASSGSSSSRGGHLAASNGNQYTTTGSTALQSSQQQQQQQQPQQGGSSVGQLHERPFQRHLAMNLENDMYYTVDFSENSQHSPLIQ